MTRQIAHKSTGSTASFQIHGKSNFILLTMVLIVSPSPLSMASRMDGNGIFVQVVLSPFSPSFAGFFLPS
jgi:hypothetical protein